MLYVYFICIYLILKCIRIRMYYYVLIKVFVCFIYSVIDVDYKLIESF